MDDIRFRRSLRASRARRAAALRARRLTRGRHSAVAALAAVAAFGSAGAVAHQPVRTVSKASASSPARGEVVRQLQRRLGLVADGVFGPRTRAAVRRFQRRSGLAVDGVAGPQTLAALGLSAAPARRDRAAATVRGDSASVLARIAQCESGGDPTAVSANGQYRGKYQFSRATWRALGGTGDPAKAPEAEQDRLAAKLLAQRGTAPWPACGGR